MNFVIMTGTLLQDPEQRQSQDGKAYATGRIGVYQGKEQDGSYKPSIIFDFSCFGFDVNTIMMAKKGDSVTVAGRLQESTNVSQTNGQTYVNKRIVANNVNLNIKPQPTQPQVTQAQPATPYNMPSAPAQPQNVTPYNMPSAPAQPVYNNASTTMTNPYNNMYQDPFRS